MRWKPIDEQAAAGGVQEPNVRISYYTRGSYLVIDVTDNGIGIEDPSNRLIFFGRLFHKEGRKRTGAPFRVQFRQLDRR